MTETFDDAGAPGPERAGTPGPHLVLLLECDRPLGGGARYSLEGIDRVVIGRGEGRQASRREEHGIRTLDLRLPGRSLSGGHARLVRVGASWAVEDLGSKNGTFVNGERVARAVLAPDDLFEVGHTWLRIDPLIAVKADAPADVDASSPVDDVQATLCPALWARLKALDKVARSAVPVLVLGDSGTGKELLARWVHGRSGRRGTLVAVNCGGIPATLVESTLFGHTKGAFSGAARDEPGAVRLAHEGTLFLDEVADLPASAQAALLRVLQEWEVVPVGSAKAVAVDVRLVAATHQPIEEMVARGAFRRDLYARMAGFTLRLPTLRERLDDAGILVAALLRHIAGERAKGITLAPEVGRALLSYEWPLNIRELEQCLASAVALAEGGRIELSHLPPSVAWALEAPESGAGPAPGALNARDEQLRLELLARLAEHRGNLADVARAMGKARMQIHRWCRRFGVDPNVYRG